MYLSGGCLYTAQTFAGYLLTRVECALCKSLGNIDYLKVDASVCGSGGGGNELAVYDCRVGRGCETCGEGSKVVAAPVVAFAYDYFGKIASFVCRERKSEGLAGDVDYEVARRCLVHIVCIAGVKTRMVACEACDSTVRSRYHVPAVSVFEPCRRVALEGKSALCYAKKTSLTFRRCKGIAAERAEFTRYVLEVVSLRV